MIVILQVQEETGFDITGLINEEEFIEATFNDQLARLYVVPNIPTDTEFKPKTRGEIKVSVRTNLFLMHLHVVMLLSMTYLSVFTFDCFTQGLTETMVK